MNSWLTSFGNELFSSHPILYSFAVLLIGVTILNTVWKHEKRLLEEKRKEQHRPFK